MSAPAPIKLRRSIRSPINGNCNAAIGKMCPHWIMDTAANVHVARDRAWFMEYTPFRSRTVDAHNMSQEPSNVLGVGTVELKLQMWPHLDGGQSHSVLRLEDVLHVPDTVCNTFCPRVMNENLSIRYADGEGELDGLEDSQGHLVAFFAPDKTFFPLLLSGPPVGPRTMSKDLAYMIIHHWPKEEQARWKAFKQNDNASIAYRTFGDQPPLTRSEKKWIAARCGSLANIFTAHGLNLGSDGEREYGRALLRGLMKGIPARDVKVPASLAGTTASDTTATRTTATRSTKTPAAQPNPSQSWDVKEPPYTPEEKSWLKKHYRDEFHFLRMHGLSIYDEDDRDEGRAIVRAFMQASDEDYE